MLAAPLGAVVRELDESWRWRSFDRGDGLSSSAVATIYQDRKFDIHVASESGLSRYNFWEWTVTVNRDPFDTGRVEALLESAGVLYAVTPYALWRLQSELQRVYPQSAAYPREGKALFVASGRRDAFLLDATARKHFQIRGQTLVPVTVGARALPAGSVLDYALDPRGRHWLSTTEGLHRRKPAAEADELTRNVLWQHYNNLPPKIENLQCIRFLSVTFPRSSSPRDDGAGDPADRDELWAVFRAPGSGSGATQLVRLVEDDWETLCPEAVRYPFETILRDRDGNYFGTTENGQLYVSADGCGWTEVKELGIGKVPLHLEVIDSAGTLWFRREAGGIVAFDPVSNRWERIPLGGQSSYANILALCQTRRGDVWLGLKNGVVRYRPGQGSSPMSTTLRNVNAIAEDTQGRVWVSSAELSGVVRFDEGILVSAKEFGDVRGHRITGIQRDSSGDLWFLSRSKSADGSHQLFRASPQNLNQPTAFAVAAGPVNDLLRTQEGLYWLATDVGLVRARLNETARRFDVEQVYGKAQGLPLSTVILVEEGPEQDIWASHPQSGVSRLRGGEVEHFNEEQGLASPVVFSMARVGESLWFGTNGGLSRRKEGAWYNLPVASAGPDQNDVRFLQAGAGEERGSVLIGTFEQGALWYRPPRQWRPRFATSSRLDFPTVVDPQEPLVLRWDAHDYRNHTRHEDLRYRYRLDGETWSPFQRERSCTPSGLAEGTHTIEIEVFDLDGYSNRDPWVHTFQVRSGTLDGQSAIVAILAAVLGLLFLTGALVLVTQRLRRSRRLERHRGFFEHFPAPTFLLEPGGRVLDFNGSSEGFPGLEGIRRADIIGRPLHLLPPLGAGDLRPYLEGLARGVAFTHQATIWSESEESERRLEWSGFPTLGLKGDITGAVVVVRDRSRQHREEKLGERDRRLSSLRNLSDRVASALRLHLDVLEELQAELQEADADGKSQRVRLLAEKIQNLQTLSRSLTVFAGRGLPESGEGSPEVGESESIPAAFSVGQLLERVVRETLERAQRSSGASKHGSLRVDVRTQAGLWPIRAQVQPFADCVHEILRNAWDAMPEGGVVTVRATNLRLDDDPGGLSPGSYLEITVRDTGVGMDRQQIEHVFEPFYSTKPRDRALGVGLSLAFGVVRAHGGDLRIESHVAQGTLVRVLWPAARAVSP